MILAAIIILAASVVENAVISSPQIGTFFDLPEWMPTEVSSARTPGSCDATNATKRVDDTTLAAVNACFEAYYERTYFAHAGQSNVWNVATYGPQCRGDDKHEFRFDLPHPSTAFKYEPQTNRVIKTRRLVEYDNLKALANNIISSPPAWFDRPNWWKSFKVGPHDWDSPIYWASTMMDGLETNYGTIGAPFPVVGWLSPASFLSSQGAKKWFDAAPHFKLFSNGDILSWQDVQQTDPDYVNNAPLSAILDVKFGEPVFEDGSIGNYVEQCVTITNTADSIVGRTSAITNTEDVLVTYTYPITISLESDPGCRSAMQGLCDSAMMACSDESFDAIATMDYAAALGGGEDRTEFTIGFGLKINGEDVPGDAGEYVVNGLNMSRVVQVNMRPNPVTIHFINNTGWSIDYLPSDVDQKNAGYIDVVYLQEMTNITRLVGVEGLTNDTRRLYTDKMSAIGITLGAMDRTYVHLTTPIPNVVTQYVASAKKEYSSEIVQDLSFSWNGEDWVCDVGQTSFPELTLKRSKSDVSPKPGAIVSGRYVAYVEDINRGFSFTMGAPIDTNVTDNAYFTEDHLVSIMQNIPGVADSFIINSLSGSINRFGEAELSGTITYLENYQYVVGSESFQVPVSDHPADRRVIIGAGIETTVDYDFGYTYGDPRWKHGYKKYPGEYSRISETRKPKIWSVYGCASLRGDLTHPTTDVLSELKYTSQNYNRFESYYRTTRSDYMSSSGLENEFLYNWMELRSKCSSMLSQIAGSQWRYPMVMLESLETEIADARSHVRLEQGAKVEADFSFIFNGIGEGVRRLDGFGGVINGGVATVDTVYWQTEEGIIEEPGSLPFTIGGWRAEMGYTGEIEEGYYPDREVKYGAKVNGKIDSWSKVDWDWNALKRTKKE